MKNFFIRCAVVVCVLLIGSTAAAAKTVPLPQGSSIWEVMGDHGIPKSQLALVYALSGISPSQARRLRPGTPIVLPDNADKTSPEVAALTQALLREGSASVDPRLEAQVLTLAPKTEKEKKEAVETPTPGNEGEGVKDEPSFWERAAQRTAVVFQQTILPGIKSMLWFIGSFMALGLCVLLGFGIHIAFKAGTHRFSAAFRPPQTITIVYERNLHAYEFLLQEVEQEESGLVGYYACTASAKCSDTLQGWKNGKVVEDLFHRHLDKHPHLNTLPMRLTQAA